MSTRRNAKANAAEQATETKLINLDNIDVNSYKDKDVIKGMLDAMNITNGKTRAVINSLSEGDKFKLTEVSQAEIKGLNIDNFVPLVFHTDKGAVIGVKHFATIRGFQEVDENLPSLGSTAEEVIRFFLYCKANETIFKVTEKRSVEVPATDSHPAYTKNIYSLRLSE